MHRCFGTRKAVLTVNFLSSPANMVKGTTYFSASSVLTYHLATCQILTEVLKCEYKFNIMKLNLEQLFFAYALLGIHFLYIKSERQLE